VRYHAASYLRATLAVMAAVVLAAAAINYVVDPYRIYRVNGWKGFNDVKPQAQNHDGLVKAHMVEHIRPNGLLLGNSRVEVGLDPEHRAFPVEARPVYNAGLEGTGPATALRYVRHALNAGTPRLAIVGVDFLDFLVNPDPVVVSDQSRQEAEDRSRPVLDAGQRRQDVLDTVFSLDATLDSAKTVAAQSNPFAPNLTAHGLVTMREYVAITRRLGYSALFLQKDKDYAATLTETPKVIFAADGRTSPRFETLAELIDLARARNIRLILVTYPYHVHVLELIDAGGLWNAFEDWKRELVAMLARESLAHPGSEPIPLWDFTGYDSYTTETVPPPGDLASEMRWYRDPGHFRRELGDLMLSRVLGPDQAGGQAPGVQLDAECLERHLRRAVADREQYRTAHPEVREQIRALTRTGRPN
jgi:hypothetical protein